MHGAFPFMIFAALAATEAPAQHPAIVCNGLKIDVANVSLDNTNAAAARPALLHPGDCAAFPDLPSGPYKMRFIERSADQTALCVRAVRLKPGELIRITADDDAKCMQ